MPAIRTTIVTLLTLALAACGGPAETPQQQAAARVSKADTAVLDDPSKRGEPITVDLANQLRMKIQCRLELDELLAARKAAAETK
jgi:predicted small lipoprotein YifL